MAGPLWTWDELIAAAGGVADGAPAHAITGFSLDSRAIGAGDVFVVLKDQRDGHDFVEAAFKAGSAAALVDRAYQRKPGDGALIRVGDTLRGLEAIGIAARARLGAEARVVAVTGSAGKTGTKEMLRACLSRLGATHAPEKSFNNHWGVPLTLARMPRDTRYGVFEIGMNHAGEITPLTRMVRPHAAVVTTVEAVHLGHFGSVEEIADAKAEIFTGLVPGGAAIINRDNPHFERLAMQARSEGARVVAFGRHAGAEVRMLAETLGPDGSEVTIQCTSGQLAFRIGAPGAHIAGNALAAVAAIEALGAGPHDLRLAIEALAGLGAPAGRGARERLAIGGGSLLLVDESYNANPASMRAALAALALVPRAASPRRIAVLGDMLELGPRSAALHAELAADVEVAGIDLLFAAGPHMKHLYDRIDTARRGAWAERSDELVLPLLSTLAAGDVVVVKGSLGSRMGPVVQAVRSKFAAGGGTQA